MMVEKMMFQAALVLWRTEITLIMIPWMGESADFGVLKGGKWQIPFFNGKTTLWGRFEMEFLMAMRHLRLGYVFFGDKKEVPVADRMTSCDRLNAHHGNSKVAKHFSVWSLLSSSQKRGADKRVFFSTKSPVAGWDRVASLYRAETQGAKLLLSRQAISARLQPGKDPAIVIGEIVELVAALDEVRIPVHEEFIWLHFVDNLPPSYEFTKNTARFKGATNTHCARRCAAEQVQRTIERGKGETISNSALFAFGSKAGRGVGRGGSRRVTHKGKLDSRGRSEGLSLQAMTCNHCRKSVSTIGEGGETTISSSGRSPKQPLPGVRLHDPLHGRQACPEFIAFIQEVGKICPR